ncbi:FxsA family protein [Thiomicrorhabdus sp. 6S3-12]|uniref:FxsA family protein n=1 Tax=Thiomicrorhabdus sp. 6S3-12 TaxID=2819681 RepID=UPI001AAE00FE|nr:FxsA family protein [Thiomicrorhabdus sp. 6S3-12]MBO1923812.1 FxsA family protein [Thiomicrorhabdus sp. 6S3-12]
MKILLLLFILVPLTELYILIQVGSEIGALPTVLLTIATAIAGVFLMRQQGMATMLEAQSEMASGKPPQEAVIGGVLIFIGGILLFIPGLVTDFLGFVLLIPPVRSYLVRQSMKGMTIRSHGHFRYQKDDSIIEGEWTEKEKRRPESLEDRDPK